MVFVGSLSCLSLWLHLNLCDFFQEFLFFNPSYFSQLMLIRMRMQRKNDEILKPVRSLMLKIQT